MILILMKSRVLEKLGVLVFLTTCHALFAEPPAVMKSPDPSGVRYGTHPRNILDFWSASTGGDPKPMVMFIHGGGFETGDKSHVTGHAVFSNLLAEGISVASINYRLQPETAIQEILRDCARAVQFLRSKSQVWNIDPRRIGVMGVSAGGGSALWLAFHADLADPRNTDPVLRESSRICCAASEYGQATYDLLRWEEVFGYPVIPPSMQANIPPFYHLNSLRDLKSPEGKAIRAFCDMLAHVSADDPPVFVMSDAGLSVDSVSSIHHHPSHVAAVRAACVSAGVESVAVAPALNLSPAGNQPQTLTEFFTRHLGTPAEISR